MRQNKSVCWNLLLLGMLACLARPARAEPVKQLWEDIARGMAAREKEAYLAAAAIERMGNRLSGPTGPSRGQTLLDLHLRQHGVEYPERRRILIERIQWGYARYQRTRAELARLEMKERLVGVLASVGDIFNLQSRVVTECVGPCGFSGAPFRVLLGIPLQRDREVVVGGGNPLRSMIPIPTQADHRAAMGAAETARRNFLNECLDIATDIQISAYAAGYQGTLEGVVQIKAYGTRGGGRSDALYY